MWSVDPPPPIQVAAVYGCSVALTTAIQMFLQHVVTVDEFEALAVVSWHALVRVVLTQPVCTLLAGLLLTRHLYLSAG